MSIRNDEFLHRKVASGGGNVTTGAPLPTLDAAVLAKLINAPSTEAKQDAIATAIGLLGTEATLALIKAWVDGTDTTSAPNVTLSGTLVQLWGNVIGDRPAFGTISVPTAFTLLNATLDTWVTDGTNDWVEV